MPGLPPAVGNKRADETPGEVVAERALEAYPRGRALLTGDAGEAGAVRKDARRSRPELRAPGECGFHALRIDLTRSCADPWRE